MISPTTTETITRHWRLPANPIKTKTKAMRIKMKARLRRKRMKTKQKKARKRKHTPKQKKKQKDRLAMRALQRVWLIQRERRLKMKREMKRWTKREPKRSTPGNQAEPNRRRRSRRAARKRPTITSKESPIRFDEHLFPVFLCLNNRLDFHL